MARSYSTREIGERILNILAGSKIGMSGVEISTELGINRITTTKYLSMFAAQEMVRRRDIGNITLWTTLEGAELFQFPDDYFKVKARFLDSLIGGHDLRARTLIQSSINSGASVPRLMIDVMLPSISSVRLMYDEVKIGNSEMGMFESSILNCVKLAQAHTPDAEGDRNVTLIAADGQSLLQCYCAEASYRSMGWQVYNLGDMSSSVNVLFDIDLPKFLSRVWKSRRGIMIIVVFSQTEEGLSFFADAVSSAGIRKRGNLSLALCGSMGEEAEVESDILSHDLNKILQWSETTFERYKE